MASSHLRPFHQFISLRPSPLRATYQIRCAQVYNVHVRRIQQPAQSVIDRYRERLSQKAREEGLTDVNQLREVYAEQISRVRKQDAVTVPESPLPPSPLSASSSSSYSPPISRSRSSSFSSPSPSTPSTTQPPSARSAIRPLSKILDLDKARALPLAELSMVWRLRHAKSPTSLCAVIPAPTYAAMESAARAAPQFVLPVPHNGEGAELHFIQWTFGHGDTAHVDGDGAPRTTTTTTSSTVLFTGLAEYKLKGEYAQPHTTVTHHTDLVGEKSVVLMEGAVVEGRGVQVEQAKWLAMSLQRFYGALATVKAGNGEADEHVPPAAVERAVRRKRLLDWFARGDERFSVEMLMEEAQRIG